MSEYQRYEFMIVERPLTREQLEAVNAISSHIEASSTHAVIEYNWGDFKHDPIKVLSDFFDGFLYWANWGSPQLAFRFPPGILPDNLLDGYDLDDFVEFTRHKNYDILDIHFGDMQSPDEWTEYELGSLMPIRDELMEGDLRALYIVWLAGQEAITGYDEEDDYDEGEEEEGEEDYEIAMPSVPPDFNRLTVAQQALAELLQVPREQLVAAARHSQEAAPAAGDDFVAWIKLLPAARRDDYLLRLARNEPGLSRLLVRELRELGLGKGSALPQMGERVPYNTLFTESKATKAQLEREEREREEAARRQHLQDIHNYQDTFWRQADMAAGRGTGTGYDEAVRVLIELRDAARQFNESQKFQERFQNWVQAHLRRPALLKRLAERRFPLPEA